MLKLKKYILALTMILSLIFMTSCTGGGQKSSLTNNASKFPSENTNEYKNNSPADMKNETEVSSDKNKIKDLLSSMSLYDKICQMLIIEPESLTGKSPVTAAGSTTEQALKNMPVGGIIYSRQNLINKEQVKTMLNNIQSYSKIPLILTCDEEGGRVNRLMNAVGTTYIEPMLNYKDMGADTAYKNAHTIASDMSSLGFNFDMAPVADVWSNPENTVIGDRAYSDDFNEAASLVSAAVDGFHSGGIGTALKHFPGHGDTSSDSHYGAVYVEKTLDEIQKNELLPFKAGIEAGSDMIMIGHLIISDVDEQPAPFSYKIVTELLRNELSFDGVIITDGLKMEAITDYYTSGEIAKKAISAGVDMLLCPENPKEAVDALLKAVEDGSISEQRIDESIKRILTAKINRGIIK